MIKKAMFQLVMLIAAMLLAGHAFATSSESQRPSATTNDMASIHAAVFDYFDGINTKNRERIEWAFDPSAQLKSPAGNGKVKVEPIADAVARWMSDTPQSRVGEILAVEITDGQVARVVFDFDEAYIDFLTLLKLDGQWKIVDKVFIDQ